MKRLLTLTSWLSVLLCAATLGLWVRSYFAIDVIKHQWVFSRSDLHSYRALGDGVRGVANFEFQYIHGWVGTVGGPLPERLKRLTRLRSSVLADRNVVNSGGVWVSRPVRAPTTQPSSAPHWRWAYLPVETTDVSALTLIVSVPHWFLALLFAVGALTFILLRLAIGALPLILLRLKRQNSNSCRTCGYNLTGNTSGVCPECGTRVPETSTRT